MRLHHTINRLLWNPSLVGSPIGIRCPAMFFLLRIIQCRHQIKQRKKSIVSGTNAKPIDESFH